MGKSKPWIGLAYKAAHLAAKAHQTRRADYLFYILSPGWRAMKKEIIVERGHQCEECGETRRLQLHHKTYERFKNERREDLLLLCYECHRRKHPKKRVDGGRQPPRRVVK